ncbi:MAG: STAS domain-containing protein [Alphaproteobacteria bacterium]|nr:STAS domain-containing protein [Alphaproteobacteria bacterium]
MNYELKADGDGAMVVLRGDLTSADRDAFETMAERAVASNPRRLTVDLQKLGYMDSAGLGMFLTLREKAEAKNCPVTLHGPTGEVRDLLLLARFDTLFTVT